jgi:hypothetical protein
MAPEIKVVDNITSKDKEVIYDDMELGPLSHTVEDPYGEETTLIKIPKPGLNLLQESANVEMRLAPNLCTVCLSNYELGEKVAWSSNPLCEHVFHHKCIQSWILKQKAGFLCACCRRAFIITTDGDDLDTLDKELGGGSDGSDITSHSSQ